MSGIVGVLRSDTKVTPASIVLLLRHRPHQCHLRQLAKRLRLCRRRMRGVNSMGWSLADSDRERERERIRRLCVWRGLGAAAVV